MKLNTPSAYSLLTGSLLFALGFLGFAFHGSFAIPDGYLLACLVLGFWGIVVGVKKN